MIHIYVDSARATFVGVQLPQLARLGGASTLWNAVNGIHYYQKPNNCPLKTNQF